jgi:UDP-glucose 4-epimerase
MELAGKTVLVTGGAGFIGSHLVDALLASKAGEVRVLDDFSTGNAHNLAHVETRSDVRIVRGDIRDAGAVADVMADAEVVFHLACRGVRHSIGNPRESHEVNAGGTLALLAEARKIGVSRFVHMSSSEVYGTARQVPMTEDHPCLPETVYGAAKLAGEAYARAYFRTYGLSTVVVRPFNNFGPRSHHEGDSGEVIPRFAVWALNGKAPVIFGDGEQTRDFIYVADTAHWLCRIAENDALTGDTINLGAGKETSVNELARIVYEQAGRPDLVAVHREGRPGDVRRHLAGVDRAKAILGFTTRVPLAEGIGRLIAHFRAHPEGLDRLLEGAKDVNWVAS